jgi:hypothetical protein
MVSEYRRPLLFYGLSIAIPWALWFAAAYLSHITPGSPQITLQASLLGVAGLAAPMVVAFAMVVGNAGLRRDVAGRLFNFAAIKPIYLLLTGFLMLASILLAQLISLAFGYSADQFRLAGHFSFSAGIFPAWFLLFIAPVLEELAWHSYGTDALRQRFNLFWTSMIFAVFWALWHLPLSFIKDYYQSNLAAEGLIYSLNFSLSIIPYVLIMNWLYYKAGRNILVAIVFHITAGFFNELFATHPDSKIIQTGLLTLLALVLMAADWRFFFKRRVDAAEGAACAVA